MSAADDIVLMAERQEQAALAAIEAGRTFGYDPTREALEYAHIAHILRLAVREMRDMDESKQADYARRLKAAVWQRLDDSPELVEPEEMHP
jgi:hypothetical protein